MTLTVTVHDDTGEQEDLTVTVADNDYFLICTGECYVAHTSLYAKAGTHVVTIKGQRARRTASSPAG